MRMTCRSSAGSTRSVMSTGAATAALTEPAIAIGAATSMPGTARTFAVVHGQAAVDAGDRVGPQQRTVVLQGQPAALRAHKDVIGRAHVGVDGAGDLQPRGGGGAGQHGEPGGGGEHPDKECHRPPRPPPKMCPDESDHVHTFAYTLSQCKTRFPVMVGARVGRAQM